MIVLTQTVHSGPVIWIWVTAITALMLAALVVYSVIQDKRHSK